MTLPTVIDKTKKIKIDPVLHPELAENLDKQKWEALDNISALKFCIQFLLHHVRCHNIQKKLELRY